jgi:predicted aspartyl protease
LAADFRQSDQQSGILKFGAVMKRATKMGRITVSLKLTNYGDVLIKERNLSTAQPRTMEVQALVNTGATTLGLKKSVIKALGLRKEGGRRVSTAAGPAFVRSYEPVRVELLGRYGNFSVVEVPESVPNLLGQIPLEEMDFVVDPKRACLIPNPEHGGRWMLEFFRCGLEAAQGATRGEAKAPLMVCYQWRSRVAIA